MAKGNSGIGGSVQSNISKRAADLYAQKSPGYQIDYEPYKRGQISKTDAGQLYKAVKAGDVKAKPELTKDLYDGVDRPLRFADERYRNDPIYYDNVERLTHSLLNKDYDTAQALIDKIEYDNIRLAGKNSRWYRYKNER